MQRSDVPNTKKTIPVLYEDNNWIAFDKPSGLLVVPNNKQKNNTLTTIVNIQYSERLKEQLGSTPKLFPCHRIDQDTSGVILYAKGKVNQQKMMDIFKHRKIKKVYIAFIAGKLKKFEGTLTSYIRDLEEEKYEANPQDKKAISHYKVRFVKSEFSVIEVSPLTGRTNQIRIQFNEIGHPLLGERKYCIGKDFSLKFRRTALHAHSLEWMDPYKNEKIKITSYLPKDMEEFLARHRN